MGFGAPECGVLQPRPREASDVRPEAPEDVGKAYLVAEAPLGDLRPPVLVDAAHGLVSVPAQQDSAVEEPIALRIPLRTVRFGLGFHPSVGVESVEDARLRLDVDAVAVGMAVQGEPSGGGRLHLEDGLRAQRDIRVRPERDIVVRKPEMREDLERLRGPARVFVGGRDEPAARKPLRELRVVRERDAVPARNLRKGVRVVVGPVRRGVQDFPHGGTFYYNSRVAARQGETP